MIGLLSKKFLSRFFTTELRLTNKLFLDNLSSCIFFLQQLAAENALVICTQFFEKYFYNPRKVTLQIKDSRQPIGKARYSKISVWFHTPNRYVFSVELMPYKKDGRSEMCM